MVCIYTDGVLEIKNKSKEEYGLSRLESFIQNNYTNDQEIIIDNLSAILTTLS